MKSKCYKLLALVVLSMSVLMCSEVNAAGFNNDNSYIMNYIRTHQKRGYLFRQLEKVIP